MDDPLLAADNDNAGLGATTTIALRGTSLDLRTVVARLLAAGPAGLLGGIAFASPAHPASMNGRRAEGEGGMNGRRAEGEGGMRALRAEGEGGMRALRAEGEAGFASGVSDACRPPSAGPLAEPPRRPVLPPLSTQELELIREMAMRDEAARDMLAEAGWALALGTRHERPPRPVFGEASGEGGRLCLGLGAAAMTAGFALWGYLG
jgi:hypothetical protein